MERRGMLKGMAGVGLAGLLPAGLVAELLSGCSSRPHQGGLDDHQFEVVTEATARLIPGPLDDPAEAGHPGAREAGVATYISTLLGAADHDPPLIFAGGPFSDRAGNSTDDMARFIQLNPALLANWVRRIQGLKTKYAQGIAALDRANFLHLPAQEKDAVLAENTDGFTDLLFEQAIEGMYCVPEYGGNKGLAGWQDIGFKGDVQPRGFTDAEVSAPLDTEPYTPGRIELKVLALLTSTAPK